MNMKKILLVTAVPLCLGVGLWGGAGYFFNAQIENANGKGISYEIAEKNIWNHSVTLKNVKFGSDVEVNGEFQAKYHPFSNSVSVTNNGVISINSSEGSGSLAPKSCLTFKLKGYDWTNPQISMEKMSVLLNSFSVKGKNAEPLLTISEIAGSFKLDSIKDDLYNAGFSLDVKGMSGDQKVFISEKSSNSNSKLSGSLEISKTDFKHLILRDFDKLSSIKAHIKNSGGSSMGTGEDSYDVDYNKDAGLKVKSNGELKIDFKTMMTLVNWEALKVSPTIADDLKKWSVRLEDMGPIISELDLAIDFKQYVADFSGVKLHKFKMTTKDLMIDINGSMEKAEIKGEVSLSFSDMNRFIDSSKDLAVIIEKISGKEQIVEPIFLMVKTVLADVVKPATVEPYKQLLKTTIKWNILTMDSDVRINNIPYAELLEKFNPTR